MKIDDALRTLHGSLDELQAAEDEIRRARARQASEWRNSMVGLRIAARALRAYVRKRLAPHQVESAGGYGEEFQERAAPSARIPIIIDHSVTPWRFRPSLRLRVTPRRGDGWASHVTLEADRVIATHAELDAWLGLLGVAADAIATGLRAIDQRTQEARRG